MKHTEQKSYFDGVNITRVPILRQNLKSTASESSENPPLKRPRLVPESPELLYNSFLRSIHDYIKATVDSITKKSKNVERDLNKLEQKFLNIKTLPRGVLTQAATYASCTPTVLRDYLDKNSIKKKDVVFKEYVQGNFHSIARDLREKVTEREHDDTEPEVAGESQLTSENDDDDGIEEEELITGNTTDLTRRRLCCLKSVLKSLLLDDRKGVFSIDDLKKECSDVEEKEAYPCSS